MNKNRSTRHIISFRKATSILCLICAACILMTSFPASDTVSAASQFSNDSQVKKYESQLATIEQNLKNLKNEIAQTNQDLASAQKNKTNLDKQIDLLYDKIEVQNDLVEQLKLAIAEKEGQIGDKQSEYDHQYELFKQRLRVTHEDGDASYIAMLFGAESLVDFLSRVDRIGAMLEYDNRIMNELKQKKIDLETTKSGLEAEKASADALAAQLVLDKAEITKKAEEAAQYINSLKSDTAAYKAQQEANEKKRKELEAELEERIKELEKQNSKYVGGTLLWPVPLDYTRITSECGWRKSPFTGADEYHNGADIPAPYGTSIYASNTGTVVTATYHWSYGNYIMIDHGGGIITLYAHCSKLLVKVGDRVKRGQTIAKVGSTGSSTGNHLHFSIRQNGNWINHRQYFK